MLYALRERPWPSWTPARSAFLVGLFALAALSLGQNVYVADAGNGSVEVFDADTFAYNGSIGDGIVTAPAGIATDGTNLFVADSTGLFQFDAATGDLLNLFGDGLVTQPSSLVVSGNSLYALDAAGSVAVFDWTTGDFLNAFGDGFLAAPKGMALLGDTLFVGSGSAVQSFDRDTGDYLGSLGDGLLQNVTGLTFGPNGTLYAVDSILGEILAFDPASGALLDAFADGFLSAPTGIALDARGRLNVSDAGQRCLFQFDTDGQFEGLYGDGFLPLPTDLAIAPVPEPASLIALGLGLASLVRRRRTSQRKGIPQ